MVGPVPNSQAATGNLAATCMMWATLEGLQTNTGDFIVYMLLNGCPGLAAENILPRCDHR